MMTPRLALAVMIVSCSAAAAGAEQLTLSATKDTTIYSDSATLSNGAGNGIFAGVTKDGPIRHALIAFNIADAIPAGARITDVELRLHVAMTQAGPVPVGLHRLLADWGEAGSNADGGEGMGATAAMGDATWRFRFFNDTARRWATDGGDFESTASAIETVGDIDSVATWGSTSAMVADVQGWLDAPAGNFGWLLRDSEDSTRTTKKFHSRQVASVSNRPQLLVVFDPPAPPTATPTATPTITVTPLATATATHSATHTVAPTGTASAPASATAVAPASATATASRTATSPTATRPMTDTPSPPTVTATPTLSGAATATETATGPTATATETAPTATATPAEPPPPCGGDCDGNRMVIINELIVGVNIALSRSDLSACPAFDSTGEGTVTINELILAVSNALNGC